MTQHVFVGYDTREHAAWLVCRDTLIQPDLNGPKLDVEVHPLSHRDLRRRGLFTRPWVVSGDGQMWDARDRRPFSTEFSHSRFLVPALAREMGIKTGAVVFMDCDFMFLRPITEMLHTIDRTKAISVVKHDAGRVREGVKMDGQEQAVYFRKLWSSLMVFNMSHPDARLFNSYFADTWSGMSLHGLIGFEDHQIGEIDGSWNWIPGLSHRYREAPNAVHWSLGGPWMPGYEAALFGSEWRSRYRHVVSDLLQSQKFGDTFALV
jgi:hypothetical protein